MTVPRPVAYSPTLLQAVGDRGIVLADVGARGGFDEDLLPLGPAVDAIGFEPEPNEASRLAASVDPRWRSARVLPYAVGGRVGKATLFVPPSHEAGSLLHHNPDMLEQFGYDHLHGTPTEIMVNTVTLDHLSAHGEVQSVDYLKLDVEGAELDVLKGALTLLGCCKAVKVECAFVEQRIGQPLASRVTEWLQEQQFELVDVVHCHRWRRRSLPAHPYMVRFAMPYSRGRLAQGDLLFFKRPDRLARAWDKGILALVAGSFGYFDFAVGVLRAYPDVAGHWQREFGVEIEQELTRLSAAMGRRAVWTEVRRTLRGLVPLIRSATGTLPFDRPARPY